MIRELEAELTRLQDILLNRTDLTSQEILRRHAAAMEMLADWIGKENAGTGDRYPEAYRRFYRDLSTSAPGDHGILVIDGETVASY